MGIKLWYGESKLSAAVPCMRLFKRPCINKSYPGDIIQPNPTLTIA